ncbi:TetR/AcrR family transcriptional regulator, partial [Mesorhizobium sp. M7A.F.Ca.US.006.01.1.1]
IFGCEVLIGLEDIWGLDSRRTMSVAQWAAGALVRAAVAESVDEGGGLDPKVVMK